MKNIKKEKVTQKHLLSHESLESFFIQSSAVILASVPKLPSEITKEPTINDCLEISWSGRLGNYIPRVAAYLMMIFGTQT